MPFFCLPQCPTDLIVSVFFLRVSLEGLYDTHRYMTLLGYIKIQQNTTKYICGNTYPRFGGNRAQARKKGVL